MNYFICLLSSHWRGEEYKKGDIVTPDAGIIPPAVSWVSFVPPVGLRGAPVLTHVEDPGNGNLTFRYSLKGVKKNLVVKCRVGMPMAHASLVEERQAKDGSGPPAPASKPKLEFGAGLVTTEGRSYVGWNPGRSRPEPQRPKERDLLHIADDEPDWLHRGLE